MSDFIGVTEVVTEDVFNSSCYAFPGALFKTIWLYCEMCLIQKKKSHIKVPVKSKLNLFTLLAHITSLVVNN